MSETQSQEPDRSLAAQEAEQEVKREEVAADNAARQERLDGPTDSAPTQVDAPTDSAPTQTDTPSDRGSVTPGRETTAGTAENNS